MFIVFYSTFRSTVLDQKRSQNVGILISSRHLDVQEVESAVYNLDTSIIDLETLQKIFELRATEDELATMRLTLEQQPDAVMDKPETFLLELANIPHFSERVACFMFQNSFFESLAHISSPLNNLKVERLSLSILLNYPFKTSRHYFILDYLRETHHEYRCVSRAWHHSRPG